MGAALSSQMLAAAEGATPAAKAKGKARAKGGVPRKSIGPGDSVNIQVAVRVRPLR